MSHLEGCVVSWERQMHFSSIHQFDIIDLQRPTTQQPRGKCKCNDRVSETFEKELNVVTVAHVRARAPGTTIHFHVSTLNHPRQSMEPPEPTQRKLSVSIQQTTQHTGLSIVMSSKKGFQLISLLFESHVIYPLFTRDFILFPRTSFFSNRYIELLVH